MNTTTLTLGHLSFTQLRGIWQQSVKLSLDAEAVDVIDASIACVDNTVAEGRMVYNINTDFDLLAQTRVATEGLQDLQCSPVLSHATGIGEALDDAMVRPIMVLKINNLACGFPGIRLSVIKALVALVNAEVYPLIPAKGSVGVSGDLTSLAHTPLALLGGDKARWRGEWLPATDALRKTGPEPITLKAKEELALLNGTQASTAFALRGLFETQELFVSMTVCGALIAEAVLSSRRPLGARIHAARGQCGRIDATTLHRHVLTDTGTFSQSHHNCGEVQDPYSLRCQPQVMGACLTQMHQVMNVLLVEVNTVSDNPLVFIEEDDITSDGNFHTESVTVTADNLTLAIAGIGSLSGRQITPVMGKYMSQLPPFLVKNDGVNSGSIIAQVTVAVLVNENKALAHPHSVDSLPTSVNQEDHVSMASATGCRLWEMVANMRDTVAMEWLAVCQGINLRERLASSPLLEQTRQALREQIAHYTQDRFFAPDIECAIELLAQGTLL